MAQAHPPPPPPQHPPPAPATALGWPLAPVENAANTENSRRDSLPQSGQGAGVSIWLIERRFSKRLAQVTQVYS